MPTYNYSVRDKAGKIITGKLDGDSRDAVGAKLRQMGYIILELDQQSGLASLGNITFGTGVKPKDITIFARQFSTMINAGLSLTKCLSILADQTESDGLRDVIQTVRPVVFSTRS
jgi:type IV pilus assembly protein PilC